MYCCVYRRPKDCCKSERGPKAKVNALTPSERLIGLIPVVADWHTKVKLLDVSNHVCIRTVYLITYSSHPYIAIISLSTFSVCMYAVCTYISTNVLCIWLTIHNYLNAHRLSGSISTRIGQLQIMALCINSEIS